jgi:hypothetical protein
VKRGTWPHPEIVLVAASVEEPDPSIPGARRFLRRLRPIRRRDAVDLLAKLLRPLTAGRITVSRLAAAARGSPLRLRKIARALHGEFDRAGLIPLGAGVPP